MRIPVTGHPSIDQHLVRLAHDALKARAALDQLFARWSHRLGKVRIRATLKAWRSRAVRARRKAEAERRRGGGTPARF